MYSFLFQLSFLSQDMQGQSCQCMFMAIYSNCLFCPKIHKGSPVYLWLFQLSFLSQDTQGKPYVFVATPIVFFVPRHARQVLCTHWYSNCLFCPKTRKASPMYLYSYFSPMSICLLCPNCLFCPNCLLSQDMQGKSYVLI